MKKTILMGILNCTPDSFFDGGQFLEAEKAIQQGLQLIKEGADIIDVGGQSSRPGAISISEEIELSRIIPVITELAKNSIPISIDTFNYKVAEKAIGLGASLINDISGGSDNNMRALVAESKVKICIMHMQGNPQTMQKAPYYPNGIVDDLLDFFSKKIDLLLNAGAEISQIIIDPGIGFGKTVEDNISILHNLDALKRFNLPLLLGVSRKSFMSKILNKPAKDLLPATLSISSLFFGKADYLRAHDVKEHRQMIDLLSFVNNINRNSEYSIF